MKFFLYSKRGQISVFLIIGIILIIGAIFYYARFYSAKSIIENAPQKADSKAGDVVKSYVESCIKNIAEKALFEKIGEQAGYVDVDADPRHGESGIVNSPISPAYTQFQGKNVPYYLEAECDRYCPLADGVCTKEKCRKWAFKEHIPDIDAISKKLANYIAVEFEDCFKKSIFEDRGMKIDKPNINYGAVNFDFKRTNVDFKISANKEDISIILKYPITITEGDTKIKIDSFVVVLPIRLKALHDSSIELVNNIKAKLSNDAAYKETDFLTDAPYSLSASDCSSFDKNVLTNVYVKISDSGKKEIVQFVDFSTYQKYYSNSYIFQFAVKNIDVQGNCVG